MASSQVSAPAKPARKASNKKASTNTDTTPASKSSKVKTHAEKKPTVKKTSNTAKAASKKTQSKTTLSESKKAPAKKDTVKTKKTSTQETTAKKTSAQKTGTNKKTSAKETTASKNATTVSTKKKATSGKAKGGKRAEKIALYAKHIKKYYGEVDRDFLTLVVKNLGPSIYKKNAETISCSDPKELKTVRKNFLIKKLGIDASDGVLNAAIQDVCEELKSSRTKYRATFYYALAKKFKKESALV